jgi:tetratricopeptide (TPR) repeat protein
VSPANIDRAIAVGLVAVTLVVYARAIENGFVNFDDDLYVSRNPHVLSGLTEKNLQWSWTTLHAGYFQPLTWMSFQLDAELFGPEPAGFHRTNVLLHTANVLLIFVALRRMTGEVGRSVTVALLFAVHPLHVESVAWITERKDVLSLFFGLLAILAYIAYARRPGFGRYIAVTVAFVLALLAKPMLVTLPFVFLLLDFWPLRRNVRLSRLLIEKAPLFATSVAAGLMTIYAQRHVGALLSLERIPFSARASNALVAYGWYLEKTVWPMNLAPFYPHPGDTLPWWLVALCALLLVVISGLVLYYWRRQPAFAVGWIWFVVAIVPVLGLVQAGDQAVADRFVYYPHLGLLILIVWAVDEFRVRRSIATERTLGVSAIVGIVLAVCTWMQIDYWRDSITVLEHALDVSPDNPVAHYTLGAALLDEGKAAAAVPHFSEAVRLDPKNPKAHYNLGLGLVQIGKPAEAVSHYREAIRLNPDFAGPARYNLGVAFAQLKDTRAAIQQFNEALRFDPEMAAARYNLGVAHAELGEIDEAIRQFRTVLDLSPTFTPTPHAKLGSLFERKGDLEAAADEFTVALVVAPDNAWATFQLGRVLARQGKWAKAEACFRQALQLQPQVSAGHCGLARALIKQGRNVEAQEEFRLAFELSPQWPNRVADQAWTLATNPEDRRRDGWSAVELAEQACEATRNQDPRLLDVLAVAYAETGQFDRAEAAARSALALAAKDAALVPDIEARLELYRMHKPYRTIGSRRP